MTTEAALVAAQTIQPGPAIWSDGSTLENGRAGAGLAWQDSQGTWKTGAFPLGLCQEVFDTELYGALQALRIARRMGNSTITILLDYQAEIARLRHTQAGPGQTLAIQVHEIAQDLIDQGQEPIIQWVPGHIGVEGNERADQAAKQATSKPGSCLKSVSLAFTGRARTDATRANKQSGLERALAKRPPQGQRAYPTQKG